MLTSPLTGDYRKKKPASVKAADVAVSMTPVGSAVEIAEELDKDDPSYGKVAIIAAGDALGAAIPAMGPVAKSLIKKSDDIKDVWSYPEQLYDSADTSINVSKKPAGYNELKKRGEIKDGDVIVDIGGGRFDNLVEDAAEEGATVKVYDPFNRTPEHNAAVVDSVRDGQADMAMSHNVLNVIQEDKNIIDIATQAENALKPNGKAHFSVYEGDGKGVGKVTTKGYQRNEKTQAYVPLIEQVFGKGNVTKKGKIITATKSVKGFSEGGMALEDQMEMNFGREVPDNTIGIDPVSGNEIPLGSNAENVRDDIPANLSEGEIVIPADVVNFHGVKLFEDLRAEAKMGYAQMAADGRMGGEPMMEEEDMDIELTIEDLNVMDDEEPVEMNRGGMNVERGRGSIYKSYSAPKTRKPVTATKTKKPMTAAQHQAKLRGGSSSNKRRGPKPAPVVQTNIKQPSAPVNKDTVPTIGAQINFPGFEDTTVPAPTSPSKPQSPTMGSTPSLPGSGNMKYDPIANSVANDAFLRRRAKAKAEEDKPGFFGRAFDAVSDVASNVVDNVGNTFGGGSQPNLVEGENYLNQTPFLQQLYQGFQKDKEAFGFDEGGLVNPEPFYSQKGGFDLSHMEETGTYVQEYMNDEGHRIYVTFIDGVPQMEIPEGYYPVGPSTNLNTIINSSIPTMDGISSQPVQQSSSDRDRPETPAPTPVNYKELSIDELKAMISDQRTMGSKIFAGLSPLTKIIMWDQTRRTKGEIERRLEDPNTSEVDKMRLNNLLELMNREEPGLVKTLLDKATGKEFERIASQIPKPVLPDVDYSDPTLAPDQGIAYTPDAQEESSTKIPNVEPEIPEPYQPEVPGEANVFSDETIEAAEKISKDAAEKSFSQPQSETGRMLQQQRDTASERRKEARDRSRDIASVAQQTGSSIAQVGRDIAPSNERQNIDYGDPRRGMMNKGGIVKKKKSKKKKSK